MAFGDNGKPVCLAVQLELAMDRQKLAAHLEAVMADSKAPKKTIDADTPVDKTLKLLDSIIMVTFLCCSQ